MKLDFSAFPNPTARNAAIETIGAADEVNAGWIPPHERDAAMTAAHDAVIAATPNLVIVGAPPDTGTGRVHLWDCWKTARPAGWPGIHQITGSCVGAGGGNALFSLAAADVVKRRDPERIEVPFWLLPYGISRMLLGLHSRGDGSSGSTFAEAVKRGHLPANTPGLPSFTETASGLVWGERAELDWSQGRKVATKWTEEAKQFPVKSTALCRSSDDVRDAIRSYFPVTIASNWGGLMRPGVSGSGENARLINRRSTTWNHQMSVQGWEDNPEHGELFFILNQWSAEAHGRCPSGAPAGGFWVKRKDMDDIVRQGESFAFSQFDGFPAPDSPLDFSAF